MHGLINRSIQNFLRDSYGASVWTAVLCRAGVEFDSFEPMLTYPRDLTDALVSAAAAELDRPREGVLEDLGTYLVSHPHLEPTRRLLRFGGVGFVDFLLTLEDLPGRARLALPDLDLPDLSLADLGRGRFRLHVGPMIEGVGHVVMGLLRAMADDYGALVLLDHEGRDGPREVLSVLLLDQSHATARSFDLALPPGS